MNGEIYAYINLKQPLLVVEFPSKKQIWERMSYL